MNEKDVREILRSHLLENQGNRLTKQNILGLVEMINFDLKILFEESSSNTEE